MASSNNKLRQSCVLTRRLSSGSSIRGFSRQRRGKPEFVGQSSSCLAAQGEGYPLKSVPLAIGAAGADSGYIIQALGENPALAGRLVAEELPHLNP
ncbi:hypothetical protein [Rubrobacter aplysinae]|uniref:hypothetical protein n=1 Tax=Rubrobacter aplysinae TaxID=909625 RepID=UPI001F44EBCE|nr:hypothetical protein [Rubrobacter aplysinae]